MHHANGPSTRRKQYITLLPDVNHHKLHLATIATREELDYIRNHTPKYNKMSFADDRNNNSNANAPRGRRGSGRAFRARARGRGIHFNQSAREALTQHPMRQGRGLQPAASDITSLTIGNNHDAPLNARKIDNNVYPTAANRDKILTTYPIYLYHPSPRQDLQSPLARTPLSPAHIPVLIENQYLTGVHSAKDPNVSTYTIFMYLSPRYRPRDRNPPDPLQPTRQHESGRAPHILRGP